MSSKPPARTVLTAAAKGTTQIASNVSQFDVQAGYMKKIVNADPFFPMG
jgi:hypothetical protein